jgi:hypothetical protein
MEPGVRHQERALMRGILICLLAFAAGTGLWAYNVVHGRRTSHLPAPPQAVLRPIALAKPAPAPIPAAPVIATVPGPGFVHRGGSDLRDKPKASGHVLKKEAKGARVILEALEDGGWARATDGNITGHMRPSVLGLGPPAP